MKENAKDCFHEMARLPAEGTNRNNLDAVAIIGMHRCETRKARQTCSHRAFRKFAGSQRTKLNSQFSFVDITLYAIQCQGLVQERIVITI